MGIYEANAELEKIIDQSVSSFQSSGTTSLDLSGQGLWSLPETVKSALKALKNRGCTIEGINI